jgi:hypothetical protein
LLTAIIVIIMLLVLAFIGLLVFGAFAELGAVKPKPKKKPIKATVPGAKSLEYPATYRSSYAQTSRTPAKKEDSGVTKPTTSKPKATRQRRDYDEYAPSYAYYEDTSVSDFDSGSYTYEAPASSDNSSDNSSSSDQGSGGSDYTPPSYSSDYSSSSYSDSGSSYSSDSGSSYSSSSYDSGSSSSYDSGSSSSYDSGSSYSSGSDY